MIKCQELMIDNFKMEDVHTFDGFYKNVILKNDNLIIPFFNLGILYKNASALKFLNYCYLIFLDVQYLSVYLREKRLIVIDSDEALKKYYCGGTYLDDEVGIFNDLEISCKNSIIVILNDTLIADTKWVFNSDETSKLWKLQLLPDEYFTLL